MRRPGFGVTILILIVLTVIGLAARSVKSLIPPEVHQSIGWKSMGPDAVATASSGKPIMLVVATPWSKMARMADEGVFADPYLQAFVNHTFVCVRIDGSAEPEWLTSYLPLSRIQAGLIPDFQIWFLDSSGMPYDSILLESPNDVLDYDAFRNRLDAARDEVARDPVSDLGAPVPGKQQRDDLSALLSSDDTSSALDPSELQECTRYIGSHPRYGGFPNGPDATVPFQRLLPNALRFLLITGGESGYAAFHAAADAAVASPIVDWLDGGFFIRSESIDWMHPEYDKTALQNAELMQAFALAGALCENPLYTDLAKATFDCLAGPFMSNGYVQACRVGDETRSGRSEHSSFPPRTLRAALSGVSVAKSSGEVEDAYRWAQDCLGLRAESNPTMVPAMPDRSLPSREPRALATVLGALRASAADRPAEYAGPAFAEVNGTVAARMLWVARLWSDRRRLSVAHDLFERLDDFRASDFVSHALGPQNRADYLGDYLAYADAALQDFLSTGSEQSFHRGLSVLTKARELFEVDLGVWNVVHCNPGTSSMEGLQGAELIGGPQLADDECESCVARVIRLTNAYGRLLHGGTVTANAQANSLEMDALSATNRFSSAAAPWRKMDGRSAVDVAQIAGYYCAAASVVDERYAAHAFVVGPRCRQIADQLFRIVPTHMVACCTGSVRRDLQRLPPGIYVMGRDERPSRPLSLIEAIAEFRRRDPSATAPDTP